MVEKKKSKEELKVKEGMKSLAQELKERLFRESSMDTSERKESKQDLYDKEIQELSEKISPKEIEEEKKRFEEEKKNVDGKKETLIPLEDYIKCAVHLGTKVITPHMRQFVYKRRADGLAVINTAMIDDLIRDAIKFLNQYDPEQIYLLCKREAGWPAAKVFEEITGIKVFTKKYTPGVTTNLILDNFFEAEMTIICDPWIDKNALEDTVRLKKPVLALCDTNNFTQGVTKIIPCNNKSRKSIGCILFILAREYCKNKKIPFNAKLTDFAGELE